MIRKLIHHAFCALVVSGLVQGAQGAYPEKPVKIIVPQTPGGGTDILARIVAEKLAAHWKQAVVVENKPGAGGIIGVQFVATSPADGYTLLMSSDGPQAINATLYKSLPYDPVGDFAPIATVASVPFLLVLNNDFPAKDFSEFVKKAQTTQNLTFGSAGNGSLNHLIGELINHEASLKLLHVPYKGAAPAITDLLGGRLTTVVATVPSIASRVDSGSVKALAVTSAKRSARLPNVPTIAELGFPKAAVDPWIGLLAPAKTPAAIVDKINADVNAILKEAEVHEKILGQGLEPQQTTPGEFRTRLTADVEKWGAVVRRTGITLTY